MIAFKVPDSNTEHRFFGYILHSRCEIDSSFYAGRTCAACTEAYREHDHGDEDDSYNQCTHAAWVGRDQTSMEHRAQVLRDELSKLPPWPALMLHYSFK